MKIIMRWIFLWEIIHFIIVFVRILCNLAFSWFWFFSFKKSKSRKCKITQNLNKNNDEMNYFVRNGPSCFTTSIRGVVLVTNVIVTLLIATLLAKPSSASKASAPPTRSRRLWSGLAMKNSFASSPISTLSRSAHPTNWLSNKCIKLTTVTWPLSEVVSAFVTFTPLDGVWFPGLVLLMLLQNAGTPLPRITMLRASFLLLP